MKKDKLIEQWLTEEQSADNIEQLKKAIAFSQQLDVPTKTSHEDAWANLLEGINAEVSDNERLLSPTAKPYRQWMAWAASITAILIISYLGLQNTPEPTVYSTALAATNTQLLPDNSSITLNASSSVSLIEENWDTERTLSLNGEAFFEVSPGNKFTVLTDLGNVSVLGTSFNVFVRENLLQVSTFSGKVKVEAGDRNVLLSKGDQLTFNAEIDDWTVSNFNKNQTATWRDGEFHFNSIPLEKVIEELERQFAIEIEVTSDMNQSIYSGFFSKTDLKEALQLVFTPMGMKFKVEGNKVNVY